MVRATRRGSASRYGHPGADCASTRRTPPAIHAGRVGPLPHAWFERREEARRAGTATLAQPVPAAELGRQHVPTDAGRRTLSEWLRYPDVDLVDLDPWLGP